jgi:polyhydroxyalkanoate synthesis regulator phasin
MTFGEGLKKALYVAVGAIAVGVETIAEAADTLAEKGEDVVEKGKIMVKEACAKRKFPDDEEPACVVEEDNGDNAPIENA